MNAPARPRRWPPPPAMVDAGEGWIVNVSSGSAKLWPGPPVRVRAHGSTIAAYGASKAALNRITNGLAIELVRHRRSG